MYVDVEVTDHGYVVVVEVVMVYGVVVVDDETAQSRWHTKMRYDRVADVGDAPCERRRVPSTMSPPVLPRPKETHRAHTDFSRTVWPCRGRHDSDAVSMWPCRLAVLTLIICMSNSPFLVSCSVSLHDGIGFTMLLPAGLTFL